RLVSPITQTARSGSVPKDQHLFPVFSESVGGRVIYRAPAAACNACPSKAACTDSDHAREIERNLGEVGSGMQRFHRLLSVTLLVLACLILGVDLFRTSSRLPRIVLASTLGVFWSADQPRTTIA